MVILEAQADLLSAQDVKLLCFDPKVSEEFCRAPLLGDFHRMLTRLLSDTHMHVRSDSLCCCTLDRQLGKCSKFQDSIPSLLVCAKAPHGRCPAFVLSLSLY